MRGSSFPPAPPSYWLDSYGSYEPEPRLEGRHRVDVAVIGGGFTGLASAYEIKQAEPSLDVTVLEAQFVGYGASGRNGSFAMTTVGLGFSTTALLRGKTFLAAAHRYMERAVDGLDDLISREGLACDRTRPGFLRVATTPSYVKRIRHDLDLMCSLGFDGLHWLDAGELNERVASPRYLGALWEPRLLLVNPLKLVREEKRLVMSKGVMVYEQTPVVSVEKGSGFIIRTPKGSLEADRVVFATNAYSHLFPEVARHQIPAFTYMVATRPLTDDELAELRWDGREGIEDARNLIHYYRLTSDNRLVMGGGPVGLTYANNLNGDHDLLAWKHLAEHIGYVFPHLEGIDITHRWGGPFSVTLDLTPAVGYVGDQRAAYSLGCIGHGVAMSHRNAMAIRDLILDRDSEILDSPIINRRVIPWPSEPLRMAAAATLRGYLRLEDWYHELGYRRR